MSDATITFDGELSGIKSTLDNLTDYTKSFGDKIKGIGIAAFASFGIHEGFEGLKELIDAGSEAAQVNAKLASVLDASGHAAGFSKEQLSAMAESLQGTTLFAHDAIKSAETMIATFSEIRGDQFEKTTKLALDMATVMGTDAKSAAEELGKSLNDPIRGSELLARQGVLLTQAQKDQIATMTQTGNVAGAQAILLDQLSKKYGGAADAAAAAAGGGFKQLANIGGDIREALGTGLLTVLDPIIPLLKEGATYVDEWAESFAELGPAINDVAGHYLKALGAEFEGLWKPVGVVLGRIEGAFEDIFGNALGGSIGGFFDLYVSLLDGMGEKFNWFGDQAAAITSASLDYISGAWVSVFGESITDSIKDTAAFAVDAFHSIVDVATTVFTAVETVGENFFTAASTGFSALWGVAVAGFEALEEIGSGVLIELGDLWQSTFGESASESVTALYGFVKDVFVDLATVAVGFFTAAEVGFQSLPEVAEFTWKALELGAVTYFEQAKWTLTVAIPGILDWFFDNWKEIFTDIFEFTKTVFENLANNIVEIIKNIPGLIKGTVSFSDLWTDLGDGFKSTLKELPQIAAREMSPLEKQLTEQTGNIGSKLYGQFQDLNQKNLDALGLGNTKTPEFKPAGGAVASDSDKGDDIDGTKKPAGPGGKAPARADRSGDGGGGSGSNVGEGAAELFKRIASAAAGENPQLKAAEKTADATAQTVDHVKRSADALDRIDAKLTQQPAGGAPNVPVWGT